MATLYEYYTSKGQALPSLTERAKLYEQYGLGSASGYTGTATQNTSLLGKLSTSTSAPTPTPQPTSTPTSTPTSGYFPQPSWVNQQQSSIATPTPTAAIPTTPVSAVTPSAPTGASAYTGVSIVDYLKSVGQASDYGSRATLAAQKGIANYTGTAEQNTQLLNMLKGAVVPTTQPSPIIPTAENKTVVTSEEPRQKSAQEIIDEAKKGQEETKKTDDELATLTKQAQIAQLKKEMGIDTGIPVKPTLVSDYEALRSSKGLTGLEDQINALNTTIADAEASVRQGMYDQEGKLMPMELIGTRQRELARQGQELLDTLNRRKQTMVDELTTKTNLVNNIMNLTGQDYTNAKNEYDSSFSKTIQLYNILDSEKDKALAEENVVKDTAKANLSLLLTAVAGKRVSDIPADIQLTINKLALESGTPVDIVNYLLTQEPDKKYQYHFSQQTDAQGKEFTQVLQIDPATGITTTKNIYSGGKATMTSATTASFYNAVDEARKLLTTGTNWGIAWDRIKSQFPDVDNVTIDSNLGGNEGADFWKQQGAYQIFKGQGVNTNSTDNFYDSL